jgi:hypothetical protein
MRPKTVQYVSMDIKFLSGQWQCFAVQLAGRSFLSTRCWKLISTSLPFFRHQPNFFQSTNANRDYFSMECLNSGADISWHLPSFIALRRRVHCCLENLCVSFS